MEESKSSGPTVVNLVSDTLNFNDKLVRGTRQGNESVNVLTTNALGIGTAPIGANAALTYDVPVSSSSLLDSNVELHCRFTVEYSDTGATIKTDVATALSAIASRVGFQSFPLNRIIDSASVRINDLTLNSNPRRLVTPLLYSMSKDDLRTMSTLAIPDHQFSYDNAAVNIGNVLRDQSDSPYYSRGYNSIRIEKATFANNTLTVEYEHKERLLAKGFNYSVMSPPCYVGVNDLTVNLNCVSDIAGNMLAADPGFANLVSTVTINKLQLKAKQYRPSANLQRAIPTQCFYNAPQFNYQTVRQTVVAGATEKINSGVRSYNVVPKMYVIYASTPATATQPERLYPIKKVSINSGIKMNLMQSYQPSDLYEVSRSNGYNGSASQFFNGPTGSRLSNGCMLLITPSNVDSDLYFQSNVAFNHTFEVSCDVTNPSGADANIYLHVVSVQDNYLMYSEGRYTEMAASISPQELLVAKEMYLGSDDLMRNRVMGGSIWGWIKKAVKTPVFKAVTRFARNNIPVLKDYAGDHTAVGRFAKKHGYGKQGNGIINLGGARMSQKELLRLL